MHEQRRDGVSIVTVSVGAAFTRNQTGAKLEKIIHEADRALYLAKASGRNCARLFDPNDPQSSDESENIAALLEDRSRPGPRFTRLSAYPEHRVGPG